MLNRHKLTNLLLPLAAFSAACILTSCQTQSVYLQGLQANGPESKPPLFMTNDNKPGDIHVVPKLLMSNSQAIDGKAPGHSNVNDAGVYQVDTVVESGTVKYYERNGVNSKLFEGRDFHWDPPKTTVSLNFEYVVTHSFSVVVGANYSSAGAQNYLGAIAGTGFFFEGRNLAVRIDLGAHLNQSSYDVQYIVATTPFSFNTPKTQVDFFHETGKATYINAYGAFTTNTKVAAWPVQAFLQLAILRQTLVDIDKRTTFANDSDVLQSTSFFIVTPGIYVDLSQAARLVLGVHLSDETELLEVSQGAVVAPFVQFEFGI